MRQSITSALRRMWPVLGVVLAVLLMAAELTLATVLFL